MKKIGFTLAEVLLTLSIIGVVSTMTVPSLMTSIDDRELQAQAKKAYNTIQSAISMQYALSGKTPDGYTQGQLLGYLVGKQTDKQSVKYIAKEDETSIPYEIQLPDGQVLAVLSNGQYCYKGNPNPCHIQVDINGSDGPTFSIINNGGTKTVDGVVMTTAGWNSTAFNQTAYKREYRDLVYFEVEGMSVRPKPNHANTKRYFLNQQ